MPRFFFPLISDETLREDTVGSECDGPEAAVAEGYAALREMAIERLRKGEGPFSEAVQIRDADGHVIGRRCITVAISED